MASEPLLDAGLGTLADHLRARLPAILDAWRAAIRNDPQLEAGASLPRAKLDDHIPAFLESYARQLASGASIDSPTAEKAEQEHDANAHGLQRWQQGYDLREVTREWGCLQLCLVDEIERFTIGRTEWPPGEMARARRSLAELCSRGVSDSTAQYFKLAQIEAAGTVRDLERALEQVRELERSRGELWQQLAHDLRGNLGVVSNVALGLTRSQTPELNRDGFLSMLSRNVGALHRLLDDVTDLARLQAGQEARRLQQFDAAQLLRELCNDHRSMADEQGLTLEGDGAAELVVEGDPVKTRRIVQNLLLNALKYTAQGGVTMHWGDSAGNDGKRWLVSVRDSGPGLHAGPGAPIAHALETATEAARLLAAGAPSVPGDPTAAASHDPRPVSQAHGEGLGLSIVKRLCELLDASIEVDSSVSGGTTFRILLPRRYSEAGPAQEPLNRAT